MKLKKILFAIAFIAFASSCSLVKHPLAPNYNAVADSLAVLMVDEFEADVATFQPGITYTTALPFYNTWEAQAQTLISLDSTRKNNTQIIYVTNEYISQIEQTKTSHQLNGKFNTYQLKINIGLLRQAVNNVAITEKHLK